MFFGIVELTCRIFDLTDKMNDDFRFYIRRVDNDLRWSCIREDPLLMWSPKPNYDDGKIKTNSEGLRDREYDKKKDSDAFRILCLGNSSTFGLSADSFTHVYHTLLEDKLNRELDQNIKYEVINGGVPGYTSYQSLIQYQYRLKKYDPDIVTLYVGINDPIVRFHLSDKEIMSGAYQVVRYTENRFLSKLSLYHLMKKLITYTKDVWTEKRVARVSRSEFNKNVLELNRLCEESGSLLLLISPPLCKEKSVNWDRREKIISYRKELESISKEHNIHLITIEGMTEKSDSPTVDFFSDRIHPNNLGHIMIMRKLYRYLIGNNLLPTARSNSALSE